MMLYAHPTTETFYDILKIKEDATIEDIRQSYRSALLQTHPDKLHKSSNSTNSNDDTDDRFVKVQKAWETLSDSRSRTLYDHKLRSSRSDILVADDVALEDMIVEDIQEGLELFHQCRCGDYFLISCVELEQMGYLVCKLDDEISVQNREALPGCVILSCCSCSLKIRLVVNMVNDAHI